VYWPKRRLGNAGFGCNDGRCMKIPRLRRNPWCLGFTARVQSPLLILMEWSTQKNENNA
jgi:hypothetical protein